MGNHTTVLVCGSNNFRRPDVVARALDTIRAHSQYSHGAMTIYTVGGGAPAMYAEMWALHNDHGYCSATRPQPGSPPYSVFLCFPNNGEGDLPTLARIAQTEARRIFLIEAYGRFAFKGSWLDYRNGEWTREGLPLWDYGTGKAPDREPEPTPLWRKVAEHHFGGSDDKPTLADEFSALSRDMIDRLAEMEARIAAHH